MIDGQVMTRELALMAIEDAWSRAATAEDKLLRLEQAARATYYTAASRAAFIGELRFLRSVCCCYRVAHPHKILTLVVACRKMKLRSSLSINVFLCVCASLHLW